MIAKLQGYVGGDGLAARARRGSVLTVVEFGGANVLRLVSSLILTRILFPDAFGLMALIAVVTGGVAMFSDIGIRASIIRHERGDDPEYFNTAWTLQVIRGVFLSAMIALLAPFAADFYDEPRLAQLLPVAGLSALIDGFTPTRVMTAARHLTLGRLTVLNLANQVVTLALTALLAWWLQSVWGLVFGILLGGIQRNISARLFMPGTPNRFTWNREAARDLIGFGKFVFLSTIATFFVRNGDRAILGKLIALDLLGLYNIALTLASVPMMLIGALTSKIVFPLYSRRKPHENAANRRKIFRARYALTGVAVFGSLLLVLLGDPLVRFLYDARYATAGGITVLIVIGFLPFVIVSTYNAILLANNRSDLHALVVVCDAVLKIGVLFLAIRSFGVVGAALAPAVSTLLHYPILIAMTRRYQVWDPKHDLLFAVLSVVIAGLGWWLYGDVLSTLVPN
ncbi:Membrane protein involved in the export of O-antigen and teichoic acid [Rhodovulum sp. ES.010]|uniref:oligosaccharide flippase family protein n=1 Tax=Rhodovulum sp. ES.010 TaxID=1882821 RepID=UPI00092869B7|nr:oligosaccharide flippase family protein [Rhodovulum sp. ES.010]SIO59870.1 Membrane protein involved in the export of O-antigen and teichoic acid [Rhodovulum sp. ES.010]